MDVSMVYSAVDSFESGLNFVSVDSLGPELYRLIQVIFVGEEPVQRQDHRPRSPREGPILKLGSRAFGLGKLDSAETERKIGGDAFDPE